ncbi:epoxide hydrolase family protein [uncultured Roseobacter sp.]|uniref:epoxide hydrolase family protein n=1 Tax=uncultured Roseobacter sp. TaxID=114847 RepID=UPI002611FE3B|nr:epoxide hydrolase family protein [uncultured Roseobacter sp.]
MKDRKHGENAACPFACRVSDDVLNTIRTRVAQFPWHEMPDDGGWDYGTNLDYMRELCAYWVDEFDWRAQEERLNSFPQFMVEVDGIDLHFIHETGSGPNPIPLLISHGWPGSVAEFLNLIEPLAHPERFGGDIRDAFTVIAPSLPGFGFSGRPPRPYGPRKMAGVLASLMTRHLGFESYLAQGGDWGGAICSWLGYEHAPACSAIHINVLTMRHPDGPQTPQEIAWARQFDEDQIMQNGYRTQQATRPQTLSYAMMDSPVGIAAWLVEKFHDWSDVPVGEIESAHSKDELLTNIMIYIVTRSFNSASWIYYGRREEGGRILSAEGRRVEVPTGCAVFPAEMLRWPPKSYADRIYNITHWTEMPRGGHFAAMEEPEMLVNDIRKFARTLRR